MRLWLPRRRTLPKLGTRLGLYIHPDAFGRERADAAIRFWRSVVDPSRSAIPPPIRWPQRDHVRMAAMLFAHDLQAAGIGQRAIARTVSGAEPGADWASSFERSALRRLLRDATRLVAGGYVELLRPPKRQGRR